MLHRELLSRIWGPDFSNEVQYLRTWVSRLRAKLDPDDTGELITTFPASATAWSFPVQSDNAAKAGGNQAVYRAGARRMRQCPQVTQNGDEFTKYMKAAALSTTSRSI